MISEQQLYGMTAAVMLVVALGFAVLVARRPPDERRYYLPILVIPAVTAVSFGLMSQGILLVERADGQLVPVARLLAYLVVFPTTMGYIGWSAGLDGRETGGLAALMFVMVGSVGVSWLLPAYSSVGSLLTLVSLLAIGYLLLRPYDRRARSRPGALTLLYGKLRNLLLMLWVVYVVLALASRQALGLLDPFTGVFLGNYFDLIAVVGFGIIVLRAPEALALLIDEYESDR